MEETNQQPCNGQPQMVWREVSVVLSVTSEKGYIWKKLKPLHQVRCEGGERN